jgi:hypothetical protein
LPRRTEKDEPEAFIRLRHATAFVWTRAERVLYHQRVLSPPRNRMPDFVGIGAMKAGTTWIYRQLREHPDIWFGPRKEIHYFDNWSWHPRPLFRYTRLFRQAPKEVKCGEITPAYSILPADMVHYISLLMPETKFIFILRDPVERAWSMTKFWYIRRRREADLPVSEEGMIRFLLSDFARSRGEYMQTFRNWEWTIPEERLHIDFHDRMVHEPKELLEDLFEYIGVTKDVDWSCFDLGEKHNKSEETPMPDRVRSFLTEFYREDLRLLRARFGDRVAHWGEA